MANVTIDSNLVGLAYAFEASLKTLPTIPLWQSLEPNSYTKFGGDPKTVARDTINASRQNYKGTIVDIDASGGFNVDFTQNNLQPLLQAFLWANMRQKPATSPFNGQVVPITGVNGSNQFTAAAGLNIFVPGAIVFASGFSNNNGAFIVSTTPTATQLTVQNALTAEANPPAGASIEMVGFQFNLGELSVGIVGNKVTLTSTASSMNNLSLTPGEYIFVGGDNAATKFASGSGFGRVYSVTNNQIVLDMVNWTPVTDNGAGKTVQVYVGRVLKNELLPSLIVRKTLQLERTLGNNGSGVQAEYLLGAVANELTLNIPIANKVTADLSFIALDTMQRTGVQGVLGGVRNSPYSEGAVNTTSNVHQSQLYTVGVGPVPSVLYAFAQNIKTTIKNNASPDKAIGVFGGFDVQSGNFDVAHTLSVYFTDVATQQAIRNNVDVGLNVIFTASNAGFIMDTPLLTIGDGMPKVEKNKSIMADITATAARCPNGYTLLMGFFPYLPSAAM